ncbi:MAG: helix-turn-helix domain-containing protein, partial [Bacilli bacterium]|nr:helix-turn-helix domain-containing protein [Bacilli bacterium]
GVSIEEAAEDLKMRPSQIESLENGSKEEFKDVMSLKYFIRDYAKYLGLDGEKMIDEFNEYLFDFTSKIPLSDIEKAKEEKKKSKEVVSPYTKVSEKSNNIKMLILSIFIVLVIIVVGYLIVSEIHKNDFSGNDTTYTIRRD